jgi:outer membrane protein TolC
LLQQETRLRRLLGLPIEDGKLLHPSDEPQYLLVEPKRALCLYEALTNRIELRRQKTNIRSLELQLTAAKNLANPSLNFVAGYGLNGFGNHLLNGGTGDGVTQEGFGNAYASLLRGKETSWNMGLQYSVPLWLRSAKAQVHQLEFRIVKARTGLAAQEDEIARELQSVMQTMQHSHAMLQTNRRRFVAAQRRVDAATSEYNIAGRTAFDAVLRAEMSLTQAEVAYYRSLGEYNKSLRNLMYRMGRLSSSDGIELLDSEGLPLHPKTDPWPEGVPPPAPAPPEPVIPRRRPPEKPRTVADIPGESSATLLLYEESSPWADGPEPMRGFVEPISGSAFDAGLPQPLSTILFPQSPGREPMK